MNETVSSVDSVSNTLPQQEYEVSSQVSPDAIASQMAVEQRHPSVLPGLIGALIGSIPGVILWIVLGQLGYIAGICGFLMVRGAIFGYTKLAGAIDRKGEIFSTIVAVFMPLISEYLGIAVSVYRAFHTSDGLTLADSFASVPLNLADSEILRGLAINLLIGYVLFAISFIRIKPKQSKLEQSKIPRL
ncbi:MAG: hypothetical protein C0413_00530 [Clostridiales bacterium]|nr:hypothetical protein [Clostridiales bacterium]